MPSSSPPTPDALDWLDRRLASFDDAALIADLPDAVVAAELHEMALEPSRLTLPRAEAARSAPDSTARTERRPAARARTSAPRWRAGVLAALGLLALALASVAVLRTGIGEERAADGDLKALPGVVDAPKTTATDLMDSQTRLAALVAAPDDTVGSAAAISDVTRAYQTSREFEALSGAPIDPSLSSDRLARLLHDAYLALGKPDSAARYQP